jgi:thioredoxin reductase (NADPH)
MQTWDIAIIGCGPAGIAAGIQLRRMGESPLIFEAARVGGLLLDANMVENYPGFPDGIGGPQLVGLMREHLEGQAPNIIPEEVTRLDVLKTRPDSAGGFQLATDEREIPCRLVLIASGTRARKPDGISIPEDVSDRVFSEVYPMGDVRDKHIVIVGSGDAAFDYAINLSKGNRVSILSRSARTRCLPLLRERAERIDSIEYYGETLPTNLESLGDDRVRLRGDRPGGEFSIDADYVLLAIGREPRLDFLTDRLAVRLDALQSQGLLHLIGDVGRGIMRQTAIAAGDGVRAAMEAHTKLMELRG